MSQPPSFNERMLAAADDAACDEIHAVFTGMMLMLGGHNPIDRPHIVEVMTNIKTLRAEFHAIIADVFREP